MILACGLDARAYRLSWPSGTTLYEIDQPRVIEFKSRVLAELSATPLAHRRTVAIDLREDWPTALRAAGFDPDRPTVWSAEGLLGYLSPQAQDQLLDIVTELSAPGSQLSAESMHTNDPAEEERLQERMRTTAMSHLRARGLDFTAVRAGDMFAANGFSSSTDDEKRFACQLCISGTLTGIGSGQWSSP